ncbi:MAG: glycosyltransferase, partial [Paracoccaceae bacterium]
RQDEPRMKRILSHAFYRFVSYGGEFEIPPDARDFRLMDRRDVDALCALLERNRFMKGLYGWVGFRSIAVPVELEERQTATSKLGFKGLLKLGLTGLTSFTDRPLRIWTGIGMTLACLSIVYDAGLT